MVPEARWSRMVAMLTPGSPRAPCFVLPSLQPGRSEVPA